MQYASCSFFSPRRPNSLISFSQFDGDSASAAIDRLKIVEGRNSLDADDTQSHHRGKGSCKEEGGGGTRRKYHLCLDSSIFFSPSGPAAAHPACLLPISQMTNARKNKGKERKKGRKAPLLFVFPWPYFFFLLPFALFLALPGPRPCSGYRGLSSNELPA